LWLRFWALARYDLRLSDDEFWDMTPRQLDALLNRHQLATASREFLFAQVTSWVANTGFRSVAKPTKATDFMPSEWAKTGKPKPKPKRLTKKRQLEIAAGIRAMFPDLTKKA
jgi:hypothetical protein